MPYDAGPMIASSCRVLLRDCTVDRAISWVETVLEVPIERIAQEARLTMRGCKGEANLAWRAEEPQGTDVCLLLTYSPWRSSAHCARAANHALGCPVACDGPDENV